jgi:hypothetical protein
MKTTLYENYDTGDTREEFVLRLAYHFEKTLNEEVTFFHNLEFLPSIENIHHYLVTTDAGIRAQLTKKFFAEFKVELTFNADPPDDVERTDVRYIAGIGWNF